MLKLRVVTMIFCWMGLAAAQTQVVEQGLREINNTELFVKVIGSGEPIVILHGGPGLDHTYFLPQMAELAKDYQLIFFDQRACGRSSINQDSSEVTIDNFIADIEGIRESFGLTKMNLAGHSWGGLLATIYAIQHPGNLKSLMLWNPTPASSEYSAEMNEHIMGKLSEVEKAERNRIMNSDAFKQQESTAYEALYRIIFRASFYDKEKANQLTLTFQPDFGARNAIMAYLYRDLATYDYYGQLDQITCPTLIVHSENDNIPIQASERLEAGIPNAEYALLEGCGHFPFIEMPEAFFGSVRGFMARLAN